jgi:hypothetical protein
MNEVITVRTVGDLGAAAYLLMYEFQPLGRRGKDIIFGLTEEKTDEKCRSLTMDYLASEFHRFDSCIMSLKKIGECGQDAYTADARFVTDLGAAAYLLMFKFKPLGRKGKAIYFEADDVHKFEELALEYLTSDFHRFDSCLMSLKKLGDYVLRI